MKRSVLVLFAFFALVTVTWFVIHQVVEREIAAEDDEKLLSGSAYRPSGGIHAASEPACTAAGGNWARVCMAHHSMCLTTYADGGKKCGDGSECSSGLCNGHEPDRGLLATLRARLLSATGECARNDNPCGYFAPVINGVVHRGLWAD